MRKIILSVMLIIIVVLAIGCTAPQTPQKKVATTVSAPVVEKKAPTTPTIVPEDQISSQIEKEFNKQASDIKIGPMI